MNNLTSAFSLYEMLRVLLPGFYSTIMLKSIYLMYENEGFACFGFTDRLIIFLVISILIGGLLYSMDVPRWFKRLYKTLPSNMIEKNNDLTIPEGENKRYFENEFFKFYYEMDSDVKLKTEIQSGFFHFFVTMCFVGLLFAVSYCLLGMFSRIYSEYFFLNIYIFIVSLVSAFIIYMQKLKYSWKRNYELFIAKLKSKC